MKELEFAGLLIVFGMVPAVVTGSDTAPSQSEGGGRSEIETIMLCGNVPLALVSIPSGTFMMGSTSDESGGSGKSGETPAHSVTISSDFQLGRTEVTKAQWKAVMGTTLWAGQKFVLDVPDSPATHVSWNDAHAFISELGSLRGETFRLPTEAEWEFVCRAGTTTEYYFGDESANLKGYAWWSENANDVGEDYAHVVGQKLANVLGLLDMNGNVWEWCEDWYDTDYYSGSPSTDPTGPTSGFRRVRRGGSWFSKAMDCRSSARLGSNPSHTAYNLGFRIAR